MMAPAKKMRKTGNKEQNIDIATGELDTALLQIAMRTPEFARPAANFLVANVQGFTNGPDLKTRLSAMDGDTLLEISKCLDGSNDEDYRLDGLLKALFPGEVAALKHLSELQTRMGKVELMITKLLFYRAYQSNAGQNSWGTFKEDLNLLIHRAGARAGAAAVGAGGAGAGGAGAGGAGN